MELSNKLHQLGGGKALRQAASETDVLPFEYAPLRTQPQEIRLLKAASAQFTFRLLNVALGNPPPYVALSYYWGDPTPRQAISCNGRSILISNNLMKALDTAYCALQKGATESFLQGKEIHLWADGLCINQMDVGEKNVQVLLMREIFSKAKGTIGYIGSSQGSSEPDAPFLTLAWAAKAFADSDEDLSK
ncbi:hypothetical protein MMC16_001723 [Acarospora aff. strigata]|nr:hypothetical protein [Acarospora aff. strigata]